MGSTPSLWVDPIRSARSSAVTCYFPPPAQCALLRGKASALITVRKPAGRRRQRRLFAPGTVWDDGLAVRASLKPISDGTARALAELESLPKDPKPLFDRIAKAGELEAVQALLTLALEGNRKLRALAANALDELVARASPTQLAVLDQRWRRRSLWHGPGMDPDDIAKLEGFPISAVGVVSFHGSGHVRQRAVERLATSEDSMAVAFLLLRANDWVPQVRAPAQRALEQGLEAGRLQGFVRCVELLFRLGDVKRNDLRAFVERAKATLLSPVAQSAVLEGCHSRETGVRRRCVALAIEARVGDLRPLLREALHDSDMVVRRTAAQAIGVAYPIGELGQVLDAMLGDGSCLVRGTALEIYAQRLPEAALAPLRRALFDFAAPVRETARFELGKKGVGDFATLYRERLGSSDPGELTTALAGLSETGAAQDTARVEPLLANALPRVRAAAVRALARLGGAQVRDQLFGMLGDQNHRVSRCSRNALLRLPSMPANRLNELASSSPFRHVRLNAIDLLVRAEYWVTPTCLLRLGRATDGDVAVRATTKLARWLARYNSVATSPSRQEVEELKAELQQSNPNVEADLLRALRLTLPAIEKRASG